MFVIVNYSSVDLGINIKELLIAAIGIVVLFLVVKFFIDFFEQKKVNKILRNYKSKKDQSSEKDNSNKNLKKAIPFSKRKPEITWGGGNIKGSVPKRGDKKEFLK